MKKIRNMTYEDAKKAFESFSKKHSIDDDFDMNSSIINSIKPQLISNEKIFDSLYDVFCHGFMAGYKQHEKELKEKCAKQYVSEAHRNLSELAFYLPYGVSAEYFYSFIVFTLRSYGSNLEKCLPKKQRDLFTKYCEEAEQRQEKRNEEAKKEREQKRAAMTPEEKEQSDLKCEVTQKILYVEDLEKLKQIKAIIENETGKNKKE